jgi:chitodextrinase
VDVSSDSVVLAWDCSLAQLSGKEDKVQYKTDGDDWQTSSAECKGRKATIQGLQPATEYTFRVHAPDQIFLEEIVKVNTEPLQDTEPSSVTFDAVLERIVWVVAVVGFVLLKFYRNST